MYDLNQSSSITIPVFIHDANGDPVLGLLDAGFTKRISKNGAAFAAMTVTITEMENGWYSLLLSAAHTDTVGVLTVTLIGASGKQVNLQWLVKSNVPIQVDVIAIEGVTPLSTAVLNLKQLNVINSTGDAIVARSTAGAGHGITAEGNGTGHGIRAVGGGSNGDGINATGGATNGRGINATGVGTGAGVRAKGGSSSDGLQAEGGALSGAGVRAKGLEGAGLVAESVAITLVGEGIVATGANGGEGVRATGSGGAPGVKAVGQGAGAGIEADGGATGQGAPGVKAVGQGAGAGIEADGGATGHGLLVLGGPTSGDGLHAEAQLSGDGIDAVGAGAGEKIRGDLSGDVKGKVLGGGAGVLAGVGVQADVRQWRTGVPNVLIAGRVDANAQVVGDKTGYSLTQAFPANFAALSITVGGLVDITQAAADKVWTSATRTLTAFSTALALSVWDVLESAILVASSIGLKVKNNLDVVLSTRALESGGNIAAIKAKTDQLVFTIANKVDASIQAAGDFAQAAADKVWASATRTLTSLGAPLVAEIWNALTSGMVTVGSIGKKLADWVLGTDNRALVSADLHTAGVTVKAVTDPVAITSNVKKGQALSNLQFLMRNATTHLPQTGLTVSAFIQKDSGTFAATTNSPVEISNGWYRIDLTAAEMTANTIALRFTATGADETEVSFVTQP